MNNRYFLIVVLSACMTAAVAQTSILLTGEKGGSDDRVKVSNYQVGHVGDQTMVSLDFVLDSLRVPSNRYRAFTPIIKSKDGAHEQRMKSLLVTGRTQEIVFERDGIDPLYADNCVKVRREKGEPQTYRYADAVDSQPWHNGADVYVECDLCGCGDRMKSDQAYIASLLPPDPYELVEYVEAVPTYAKKERSLHGSAYITFVVDKWEMKPDYMDNRRELRKITDTLDVMVADPNITVREIKIHGWASPESPYKHNEMLANNRAKSLTEYVKGLYNLPVNVFAPAEATPENWIGLRAAVEDMDEQTLPHKQQILTIINKVLSDLDKNVTTQADRDELSIRSKYPEEYRYLLKDVYPGLRRSDYEISFNFHDFTVSQAKEIYKTKPYQLSLREMWDVANTYEQYSPEYNQVIQTAVNVYPDEPQALINLANVAMHQKDLLKAETLLNRAGDSAEADQARGVLAMLQGKYAEAERLLNKAAGKGLDVSKNLDALKQLR